MEAPHSQAWEMEKGACEQENRKVIQTVQKPFVCFRLLHVTQGCWGLAQKRKAPLVGTQQTVRWGGWWGFVLFAVSVASTMTSCAETGCVHRGLFCCGEKRRSGNKNQVKIIAQHKVNSRYWKTEAPAKGHAHHPKLRGKENNRKVCKMNRSLSCLVTKKPKPEVKAKSKPLEKHPHI